MYIKNNSGVCSPPIWSQFWDGGQKNCHRHSEDDVGAHCCVTLGGEEAHEEQVLHKWMMWPPLTCLQAPTPPSWLRTSCRGLLKYLRSIRLHQPTKSCAGLSHQGEGWRSWAAAPLRHTSHPPSASPSLPPSRAPEPWPWWLLAPEDTNVRSGWHNRKPELCKHHLIFTHCVRRSKIRNLYFNWWKRLLGSAVHVSMWILFKSSKLRCQNLRFIWINSIPSLSRGIKWIFLHVAWGQKWVSNAPLKWLLHSNVSCLYMCSHFNNYCTENTGRHIKTCPYLKLCVYGNPCAPHEHAPVHVAPDLAHRSTPFSVLWP